MFVKMYNITDEHLSVTSKSVINIYIHKVLFTFLVISLEITDSEVIVWPWYIRPK